MKISLILNICCILPTLVTIPFLYVLIFRHMKASRRRTQPKEVHTQACAQNVVSKALSNREGCGLDEKVDIIEIEDVCSSSGEDKLYENTVNRYKSNENDPEATDTVLNTPNQPNSTASTGLTEIERRIVRNSLIIIAVFLGCCSGGICFVIIYIISGE